LAGAGFVAAGRMARVAARKQVVVIDFSIMIV
jgi:hypothetical protein